MVPCCSRCVTFGGMKLEIDPVAEIEAISSILDAFDALIQQGPETTQRQDPSVSGWSVIQHLYHCALATGLSLRNVTSLVRGKGRLIQTEGELSERAREVLLSERTKRGEAEAPRMVTPPEEVDPSFLDMELKSNRSDLKRLGEESAQIAAAPRWIPHQLLGPFDALAWLRFTRLHAQHHLDIANDVLA